jgi:hypothetical protein
MRLNYWLVSIVILVIGCQPGGGSGDGGVGDSGSLCAACPTCGADEICCGTGGDTSFAPACLKRCRTSADCPGSVCVGIYDRCVGGGAGLNRVCSGGIKRCPGVPAKCERCGCDVFLGGGRPRCDGPDVVTHPIQDDARRLCGYSYSPCKGCMENADGGVKCPFP